MPVLFLKLSKVLYFLVPIDRLHMSSPVNVFGKKLMVAGLILSQILSEMNGQAIKELLQNHRYPKTPFSR